MRPRPEFEDLFVEEYPRVVRTVFFIVHDQGRAEEVTQDAFVQLLRHWSKVRDYDRPAAWVRRVALRLAVKTARREQRQAALVTRLRPERVDELPVFPVAPETMAASGRCRSRSGRWWCCTTSRTARSSRSLTCWSARRRR